MKATIVVSSISPGSGLSKYVLSLTKLLSDSGHSVSVITTHSDDVSYEYDMLKKCGNVDHHHFGNLSKIRKYMSVVSTIRQTKPDIIINNYNAVLQYVLPFISRETKVVHILHNDTEDFYRIGAINGRHVSGWIAPTQAIAENFNRFTYGKYESRVHIIPHGVEAPAINNRKEKTSERLEMIYVGVLYEHKGVKILPAILHKLREAGNNFHFTIVGKGILRDWLEENLKTFIEDGSVEFTGVVPSETVYELQSKADVFLYPTHLDAFGLVIAEAMINGTIPVITHLKGITDNLVDDGINGFLIEQDDVDGFVEKISLLIKDKRLLERMKTEATKKAENKFSMAEMSRNYLNYLNNLVQKQQWTTGSK